MTTHTFRRSPLAKQAAGAAAGIVVAGLLYLLLHYGGAYRASLLGVPDDSETTREVIMQEQPVPVLRGETLPPAAPRPPPTARESSLPADTDAHMPGAPQLNDSGPQETALVLASLVCAVVLLRKKTARVSGIAVS